MNAELPLFKNGEHNSESGSILAHVITPLIMTGAQPRKHHDAIIFKAHT